MKFMILMPLVSLFCLVFKEMSQQKKKKRNLNYL
uniref:Uncharacterized protein n=1 Tax=Rhizophora mucronata TaxID=61149 RepID=A0A2P2NSP6_RHIMU